MRTKLLYAAATALLLAAPGAFAQSSTTTTIISPAPPPPAPPPVSVVQPLPSSVVGHTILDANGNVVGTITEIRGDQIYVTGGQYLGSGSKVYLWPRDQIVVKGSGPDMVITTPLTQQQIVVLPSP
jgi:hypothetical protein